MIRNLQGNNYLTTRILTQGVVALIVASAVGAFAQDTNAPARMKPTVVTGSYIPTADTVGPSPVETVSPAQIEKTGQTDLLSALKTLSTSFSGSANIGQTVNNGGFGESYIAIRNLPTLVLVDGQRVNITPFSTFFGTYAVDLNTFPIAMIERVEILKDGASPIYGSDAIGGVVNLITKKELNGYNVQVDAHLGKGLDSGTYYEARFDAVVGYTHDGTKLVAGAQYYYSDPIYTKDRPPGGISAQQLQAMGLLAPTYFSPSYPGRVDSYLLAGSNLAQGAPGYIAGLNAPPNDAFIQAGMAALPTNQRNIPNYNAIVMSDPAWTALHPGLAPYIPISSTPNSQALGGSTSILNTTLLNTVTVQQQDRRNAFGNFSQEIFGKQLELYGQILYSETESRGQLAPAPIPLLSLYNLTIPADNPDNILQIPIGSGATNATPRVRSRLIETGNRIFDTVSSSWHFGGGLRGDLDEGKYHYDGSAFYSQTTQNNIQNSADSRLVNQAMTPGPGGLSALVDSAGNHVPIYNMFALPGVNDPATINAIKASDGQGGFSDLLAVQGTVNGDLFNLPAGKFQLAVGGQYVNESLKTTAGDILSSGNLIGLNAIPPFSGGVRDRYAGFVEAKFPIFSPEKNIKGFYDFEIDAAGRYESVQSISPNSSVHNSLVPKVGFRWQPIDEHWTIRGTYSQGFVVEPLIQLYGPPLQGNPTLVLPADTTDLTPTAGQQTVNTLSNPDLAPSKAETFTIGTVITPKFLKGFTISADYYHIKQTDVPFTPSGTAVGNDLNARGVNSIYYNNPELHGTPIYTVNGQSYVPTPGDQTTYITAANFDTMNLPLIGGGKLQTDGIDFVLNYHRDLERWGSLDVFVNANLTMSFDVALPGGSYHTYKGQYTDSQIVPAFQGTIPDYRIAPGLTWHYQNFDYTILANYIPAVEDLGDSHPNVGASSNHFTQSGGVWNIPAYFKIDMQLGYNFKSDTGKKWYDNMRIAVGCNNITDEAVPVIASSSEDNTDKSTYDIIGRFVYFEISKRF